MRQKQHITLLIIGAGDAGCFIARDIIRNNPSFTIAGFVDDNKRLKNVEIAGLSVLGPIKDISNIVKKHDVDELIIAMPSKRGDRIRDIIKETAGSKLTYKILPMLPQVLMHNEESSYLQHVRKLQVEDLLGGEISKEEQKYISSFSTDKTVLITGAAGSIGSELSQQIVAHNAKKIILYDWWENGMFLLKNKLEMRDNSKNIEFIIGDIKDENKFAKVLEKYSPDTIFHAAAYKHVPLMESNPAEAVKNNILGTKSIASLAVTHNVKQFVLISSDKAVNPTNVMGATKRAAEKIIHLLSKDQQTTSFFAVRFGNVINSNGSVIPTFLEQISHGGPVTVTHKDVNRFFMTIPEAVHLILQAWVLGKNDNLFVLDMGRAIGIYDLAGMLISLNGYIPEQDIKIAITGLRPGEKLYEEVLVEQEEVERTKHDKVFRTKNYIDFNEVNFEVVINDLRHNIDTYSQKEIRQRLRLLISTYKPAQH